MGTLGGTLGSTLGPFLRFERFESPATWQGSVLVVSCLRDNDVNPTLEILNGEEWRVESPGTLLETTGSMRFWKFDVGLQLKPAEQRVRYRIYLTDAESIRDTGLEGAFALPGLCQAWTWGCYSGAEGCMRAGNAPGSVWNDINHFRESVGMHILLSNGGTLQGSVVSRVPEISRRLSAGEKALDEPLTSDLEAAIWKELLGMYISSMSGERSGLLASVPHISCWSWADMGLSGTPTAMGNTRTIAFIRHAAARLYLLFQHHTTLEAVLHVQTQLMSDMTFPGNPDAEHPPVSPKQPSHGASMRQETSRRSVDTSSVGPEIPPMGLLSVRVHQLGSTQAFLGLDLDWLAAETGREVPEPRVVVELLRRALTTLPRTVTHLAIGIQGPALSFGAPEHATDGASKERAALHVAILQAVNDAATGGPTRFSVTLLAGGCAGAQALEVRTLPPSLWSGGGGNVFAVEISTGSALPLAPVRDGAGAGAGRGRHSVEGAGRGPDRARMSQGGNATSHHEIATVSTAMHHMEERTRGDPGSGRHGDIPEERAALASAWDPGTGAREDAAEKPVEEGTIESPLPQQRPQSSESPRVQPQQPSLRRRGSALGNFMKRLSMDGHAHGDARQLAQDMWEVPCKGAPPRGSGGAPAPAWCVFHPVTGVTRSAASVKSGLETAASLAPPQQSPSVKPLQAVQEDFATVETAPQPRARPASRLCGCFGGRANAVDDARVLGTDSVERAQQSHVGFSLPANHRDSAGAVPGASGRLSGSHVGQSSARSSGGWRFSGGGGSRNGSVADGGAKGLVARIRRSLHLSQAERSTAELPKAVRNAPRGAMVVEMRRMVATSSAKFAGEAESFCVTVMPPEHMSSSGAKGSGNARGSLSIHAHRGAQLPPKPGRLSMAATKDTPIGGSQAAEAVSAAS